MKQKIALILFVFGLFIGGLIFMDSPYGTARLFPKTAAERAVLQASAEQAQNQPQQTTTSKEDNGFLFVSGLVQSVKYDLPNANYGGFTEVRFADGLYKTFVGTVPLIQLGRRNDIYYVIAADDKNYVKMIRVNQ